MVSALWGALLAPLTLAAAEEPRLRINEVLYDPEGPDAGHEFVELHHGGAVPLPLDGFELWFVNGSAPDAPARVWTAPAGSMIAPGGLRVIGAAEVTPRDDTVDLALQNGPDALWLVRDGVRVDAVAWGEEASAIGEGEAAPDPTSAALGRVPDGHDTDDNARDFRVLPSPTPGRTNLEADAIELVECEFVPPWRADPGIVELHAAWRASGWSPRQRAEIVVGDERRTIEIDAGDTLRTVHRLSVVVGRNPVLLQGSTRRSRRVVQVGTADVELVEVQARPRSGEPEWIEVRGVGVDVVDLAAWSLVDASGVRRVLGEGASVAPGGRRVFTADPVAFATSHPQLTIEALRPSGGWNTLNDGDGAAGFADVVALVGPDSVIVDRMIYRARDVAERGRSLQRTSAVRDGAVVWIATVGDPTPGSAHPSEGLAPRPGALLLSPDPFTPDGDGDSDVLQVVAPAARGVLEAEVRALDGALVRKLDGVSGDDRSLWQWDGRDARGALVPPGAYVVCVRAQTDEGEVEVWRGVVGLDRLR